MGFINWGSIKRSSDLIETLKRFLEYVFGKGVLLRELKKIEEYKSKGVLKP